MQKLEIRDPKDSVFTCISLSNELVLAGGTNCCGSLLDTKTGKSKLDLVGHSGKINTVGFVGNHHCVTGSSDRSIKFWDIVKGN